MNEFVRFLNSIYLKYKSNNKKNAFGYVSRIVPSLNSDYRFVLSRV